MRSQRSSDLAQSSFAFGYYDLFQKLRALNKGGHSGTLLNRKELDISDYSRAEA
jgi:hypothetical protein